MSGIERETIQSTFLNILSYRADGNPSDSPYSPQNLVDQGLEALGALYQGLWAVKDAITESLTDFLTWTVVVGGLITTLLWIIGQIKEAITSGVRSREFWQVVFAFPLLLWRILIFLLELFHIIKKSRHSGNFVEMTESRNPRSVPPDSPDLKQRWNDLLA